MSRVTVDIASKLRPHERFRFAGHAHSYESILSGPHAYRILDFFEHADAGDVYVVTDRGMCFRVCACCITPLQKTPGPDGE